MTIVHLGRWYSKVIECLILWLAYRYLHIFLFVYYRCVCLCVCVCELLSFVWLFVASWTVAHQAPLSMGLSRKKYWIVCHSLLQGIFPTQVLNPCLLHCRWILYHLSHQRRPIMGIPWDIADTVPDHCIKTNIAIKQVTIFFFFGFQINVMFTVYYSLLNVQIHVQKTCIP